MNVGIEFDFIRPLIIRSVFFDVLFNSGFLRSFRKKTMLGVESTNHSRQTESISIFFFLQQGFLIISQRDFYKIRWSCNSETATPKNVLKRLESEDYADALVLGFTLNEEKLLRKSFLSSTNSARLILSGQFKPRIAKIVKRNQEGF